MGTIDVYSALDMEKVKGRRSRNIDGVYLPLSVLDWLDKP